MSAPDPTPWLDRPPPAVWADEVDARGLLCPLPIVRLAARLRGAPAGTVICVRATDPGLFADLIRWLRVRPATLLALRRSDGELRAWVRAD